ncbi:MAG: hypothetical protein P1Q69_17150, partial [Candidatus Thorarchaeota archaeon]|nr:hypothetical protein [Candidatus Thorarchaeota archaeon]
MEREHATVIALAFVLVGLMFFSVDTSLVNQHNVEPVIHEAPENIEQLADEADSSGNMLININENPSFEDWTGSRPADYNGGGGSSYRNADFAYSGSGVTDNYGLLIECEASSTSSSEGYVSQGPLSTSSLIEPGLSLTLDWNVLQNAAYDEGAHVWVEIQTFDGVSKHRNLYYILSGNYGFSNGSIDAWFYLNDTIGEWHSLNRDITADYIAVWGAGDLDSSMYVQYFQLQTYSYEGDPGIVQVAFDEITLTNGTYSGWIGNSNFETGTESPWSASRISMGYMEQSTDSTHETYSLNMSVPEYTVASGFVNLIKLFNYPASYFASTPGMMLLELDWKYNDTPTIPSMQYANLALTFRNESGYYYFWIYMGTYNDALLGSNSTTVSYFKMPGFGARDTWQSSRIDLYDYLSSRGISNVSLFRLEFYLSNAAPGASVSLLLDDFQIITYPLGNPGFEEDWYMD